MLKLRSPNVDIAIICSNFEESLRFYHEFLEFEIVKEVKIFDDLATDIGLAPHGFRQVRLQAGDTLIKLMDIEPPPETTVHEFGTGLGWLTFRIENLVETTEQLKSKGVEFLADPVEAPEALVVCAKAPDGVLIEFVQPK